MDTLESSDSLKRKYEAARERVKSLESEKARLEARGEAVPRRLRGDLAEYRIQSEEYRLYGHRAMVREAEQARREARERGIRDRVEAEWRRIQSAPEVAPEDIRERRRELGATQQDLAVFSGVARSTICKIEGGFPYAQPQTLQYIAAGLEALAKYKQRTVS